MSVVDLVIGVIIEYLEVSRDLWFPRFSANDSISLCFTSILTQSTYSSALLSTSMETSAVLAIHRALPSANWVADLTSCGKAWTLTLIEAGNNLVDNRNRCPRSLVAVLHISSSWFSTTAARAWTCLQYMGRDDNRADVPQIPLRPWIIPTDWHSTDRS